MCDARGWLTERPVLWLRLRSGKFTWRVRNFELFRDMIRAQKIMSPPFPAGDCSLRISVYQSPVAGSEHLSLCLESKVRWLAGLPRRLYHVMSSIASEAPAVDQ